MSKLLDCKLVLEDIINKINYISSINELILFCEKIFKKIFFFNKIFLLIDKNNTYKLISLNDEEYSFSKNNEFTQKINSNDNLINLINNSDIQEQSINQIFENKDILSINLPSLNKDKSYIIFGVDKNINIKDTEINHIINIISLKLENLILFEENQTISDSKNLRIINEIIKKAINTIHISDFFLFLIEYLYKQANFNKIFIVTNKDKSDDFQGVMFTDKGLKTINLENIQYISNINNYRELTEKLLNDNSLKDLIDKNTFLSFALIIRGKTVGFIGVDNYLSQKKISEDQIHLLQSISTQVSISVDNSILYEDMQLNAIGFKNLFEVASSFNLIIDYEQAAKVVVEKICSTISVSQGYLVSFELDSYSRVIASRNKKSSFLNSEIQLSDKMKYAISSKNIVFYNQNENKEKCFDLSSGLIIPLYIKNRLTGILCIGEKNDIRTFTDHDLKLIETISNQAVVTLENAQLYNKLEDMVVERTVELIDSNKALQVQKDKLEIYTKRLQSIISSIPDGILVINKEDKIIAINPAFKDIIHFINPYVNFDTIIDLSLEKIISLVDYDEKNKKSLTDLVTNILNPIIDENTPKDSYNYDFILEKEQTNYYKVIVAPFVSEKSQDNNYVKKNQVIVFHNITKEKEIDKLKSDFIAVVSHELKTPVSAMMGFSTLIEDGLAGETTPQQQEYLYKIQLQGERLIRLINDLLDFSKLEAGQMPLYLQLLDSEEVVNEIVETLRPLADEKNMGLISNVQQELPPIYVDPDKLKQILINLISNAIKFTPETTGLIEVKVIYNEDKKELLFSVKDNGIGIPDKDKPRLFDRFYQVDNTSTRKYGGTGLGLAIVKKLVELNNGQLWVESKTGLGSTFYFTVPIPQDDEN